MALACDAVNDTSSASRTLRPRGLLQVQVQVGTACTHSISTHHGSASTSGFAAPKSFVPLVATSVIVADCR
jgi:hypothetical protein